MGEHQIADSLAVVHFFQVPVERMKNYVQKLTQLAKKWNIREFSCRPIWISEGLASLETVAHVLNIVCRIDYDVQRSAIDRVVDTRLQTITSAQVIVKILPID